MEEEILNKESRAELGGTFTELSDGWTHYELSGPVNGKTIVLVHGNAAPMLSWDRNVRPLQESGYRLLRYDIFGHGFSDRPKLKSYNRAFYDRQLEELLEKLKVQKPFCMAGTSQGGSIAACYTANHPGDVEKLALLAPLFDEFAGKFMVSLLKSSLGDFIMSVAKEKTFIDPSRVLCSDVFTEELTEKLKVQLRFEGKKRAMLANVRGGTSDGLIVCYEKVRQQQIPVFLSWGEYDASIPRRSMDRLRALIPDIEYHLINRAGHLAHYEFSDVINPLLLDFFKR